MKNIKIIVATHKKFNMPKDLIYLPIHSGKEGKKDLGYQGDNEGENISQKNPYFCELTALFWAWKNLDVDYIGLSHYRRHFSNRNTLPKDVQGRIDSVITGDELDKVFDNVDIILPKKRKYYIENLYDHYKHTTYVETLDETRKIIEEMYPDYLQEFDLLKKRTSAHMFNMFIMKKELLNDYCKWLFDILFELEKRVDNTKYNSFHARFYGRISELLLDIWINKNGLKYEEVRVIDIEKVNWLKKGSSFIISKFVGKKYGKSF